MIVTGAGKANTRALRRSGIRGDGQPRHQRHALTSARRAAAMKIMRTMLFPRDIGHARSFLSPSEKGHNMDVDGRQEDTLSVRRALAGASTTDAQSGHGHCRTTLQSSGLSYGPDSNRIAHAAGHSTGVFYKHARTNATSSWPPMKSCRSPHGRTSRRFSPSMSVRENNPRHPEIDGAMAESASTTARRSEAVGVRP
jgi:hypothetical protein